MESYADAPSFGAADLPMSAQELLTYLRNMDHDEFTPLEGVLVQADAIGDPAVPTMEQRAILKWLGAALLDWEQNFALEEPLAAEMRRLKPLLAALSISDPDFLIPGAHPLHQLLDTVQQHTVGWQPRLGRVGQPLEQQISATVDNALAWFDNPAKNLGAICADLIASTEKARARVARMAKRLIDTEHGRLKIEKSKQQAARMINAALEHYPAPADVGEFLKGPWYDSAQLVLLKFGEQSAEWEDMSGTTTSLLDSMQSPPPGEEDDAGRRQYIFQLISQLENDLRKWLLSLQHDGEAVNETVELLEQYHAQVLRKQPLELQQITPIAIPDDGWEKHPTEQLNELLEGQWFILDTDNSQALRAMLVLRLEDEQQLLFTNHAGIKVLQKSFTDFARLMSDGKVTPLDTGASFSRCLARSAGVETQDDLDELTGVAAEKARLRVEEEKKADVERARREREQAELDRIEQERLQRELEIREQLRREEEEEEKLRQEFEEAVRLREERAEQSRQQLQREHDEIRRLQRTWEDATRRHAERIETERLEQQNRPSRREQPGSSATDLNLPVGTWLGFRDSDQAIMARLAVYNRQHNEYIFVDHHGIKMRQLNNRELMLLIARGLVDILESRSNFREEVARAQGRTRG